MAPFERDHGDVGDGPTRQYADVTLADGDVVVYSTTNPDEWVQSSYALAAEDLRE